MWTGNDDGPVMVMAAPQTYLRLAVVGGAVTSCCSRTAPVCSRQRGALILDDSAQLVAGVFATRLLCG